MKHYVIFLAMMIVPYITSAQMFAEDRSSSSMHIEGTSTLHDWKSDVEDFDVTCKVMDGKIMDIAFTAKVESIKSGKGGMDKNTYKAMNSDKYPEIKFSSDEMALSGTTISGKGQLTIAGTTKPVDIMLKAESWNEGSYNVYGTIPLKMTDFGIEPPKAMMGTIKTGDDIDIGINIVLVEQ